CRAATDCSRFVHSPGTGAMIRSALFQKVTTLVTSASLALAALAPTAVSQPALPPKAKADSAKTPAPLFTTKDFVVAGAFAVGTVAMFPLDERLAKHLIIPVRRRTTSSSM